MNDSEIEDLLRKWRPIGPPARLRERILAIAPIQRTWPWLTAAAVLLLSAVAFHVEARDAATGAGVRLGPAAGVRVADELTAVLGGDAEARELAEFIVIEQQLRNEAVSAVTMDLDVLGGEQR